MTIYVKNKYRLQVDDFTFKCCVGKNGVSKNKVEGDKKTPIGLYHIENLYYRKDRIKKPFTKLKCIKIKKNMGWGDDPNNLKTYNKLIKIKKISNVKKFIGKTINTIYLFLLNIILRNQKDQKVVAFLFI